MNILFIGDIVGRTGRNAVKQILPKLKKDRQIDLVVANGENLASGFGMTYETYRDMNENGIDYFTSGNHIWAKKDFLPYLDDEDVKVLRPANYPDQNLPGKGYDIIKIGSKKILLINLCGLVFMPEYLNNPFNLIDEILQSYADKKVDIILLDFHAEATSEKNCMGHYLDGQVTAVVGSHTHIATADERILPKGTAYITDAGMAGALNSSIGDEVKLAIEHFKTGLPFRGEVAPAPAIFNAVLIEIDDKTNQAKNIELIKEIVE